MGRVRRSLIGDTVVSNVRQNEKLEEMLLAVTNLLEAAIQSGS